MVLGSGFEDPNPLNERKAISKFVKSFNLSSLFAAHNRLKLSSSRRVFVNSKSFAVHSRKFYDFTTFTNDIFIVMNLYCCSLTSSRLASSRALHTNGFVITTTDSNYEVWVESLNE